jgi:UDP-glucose 6-dehydrogenase
LATKVAFFHELFKVGPDHIDYNNLTDILAKFPNIGPSHMKAPNDVGGLGYDGACFPKDVLALLHIMPHTILKQVHDTNTKLKEGS